MTDGAFLGLTQEEAEVLLAQNGPNEIATEKRESSIRRFLTSLRNPLVLLLLFLATVSYATGDLRATIVILVMVLLGVVLRFFQEERADRAAEKLKKLVGSTATVIRDGVPHEIPFAKLVVGDLVHLAAGDMVPADVRVVQAKDLFLNQAALTGESMPVEKKPVNVPSQNTPDAPDLCFLGSSVESGSASAVVVTTGARTYLGQLASSIAGSSPATSFDRGINQFTWLMIRFILVMVPTVFLLNGFGKHNWLDAFLFAVAVAVGLTPEMLPMIVTVNLSRGAIAMSRKKVIVKRLAAIQNFGAMNILCTDKTGTITRGKIILERYLDVRGHESERVLHYGYMNSYYQTGLKNLLDEAVLSYGHLEEDLKVKEGYRKIDEIPFDFTRRRMSVIVEDKVNQHILICKGAVDEVMHLSTHAEIEGHVVPLQAEHHAHRTRLVRSLNSQGFRVVAVAYKTMNGDNDEPHYGVADESDLTLLGYLAFLDPPKESASEALDKLAHLNVDVKVLTGDSELVAQYVCNHVGMKTERILLGPEIEKLTDDELASVASGTTLFARLAPVQKERIIRALQKAGNVVGFMGDGINDSPALKAADVSISVDSAVDIAKESSDIILLEQSLLVLETGVREGRRVFGNIIKYIKMAASSNFGNMFSVVGASAFLPYLPMLPIQVLTNNLLYDFSQTTIPTDDVDNDWLRKPRKWAMGEVQRFILFIGPISSLFDYATFFLMLYVFDSWQNPALFHTGWFIESIFTQTLIIHVIRTHRIPFIESRASRPLIVSSILVVSGAAWLTISPLADSLGFVSLPPLYWLCLAGMLVCYVALTQIVKTWFYKRYGE
ncbi:MAG TPA: magnesium-translocating P-type ATPase [Leptospiraceae bacterium]|nr:magnesium-translocating P-type ATPase [Leptospirales bacterium]HMY45865.1 magnesium-translocating P-type ATPase [Leptospiraceae bacterium]HNN57893.1 magnesium-translocating P-type ATPase [Leptospiraceae bacterium]HNN73416.1 magnesium-translocating P-type ATPase [Leptospiraceae bacterium]